jgi:hypothetical protein
VSRVRELHAGAQWHVPEVRHVRKHDGLQLISLQRDQCRAGASRRLFCFLQ